MRLVKNLFCNEFNKFNKTKGILDIYLLYDIKITLKSHFCRPDSSVGRAFPFGAGCHGVESRPHHTTEKKMVLAAPLLALALVGWFCCFTSQVNSYGHCGTVSSPNHTFSWAGLNKRLTSNSCTYFRL